MQNKPLLKILAILFVSMMIISCITPCIAVYNPSTNNTSNQLGENFSLENITANNTPFPYQRIPIDGDFPFDPHFDFRHGYVGRDRGFVGVRDADWQLGGAQSYRFIHIVAPAPAVIYVPDDYSTIQAAVDSAFAGDTIIVKSGTYYENVDVNKRLILRGIDIGIGKPVVDARGSGSAITLSADGITLDGFTATASFWETGIRVTSNDNTITGNMARWNCVGISLYNSSNNTLTGNTASSNDCGINLYSSSNNIFTGNNVSDSFVGINFLSSSNNSITGNNVSNNDCGIRLYNSSNNTITGNTASSNDGGICLDNSSSNKIYLNNFINNYDNAYSYNSSNIWNSTEKITYTYKGNQYTNYLGNYWDDYVGEDADKDGIGDIPYSIDSDKDNYPLMESWENYFMPTELPDLTLSSSDISFSNPNPVVGDTVTITATIHNIGNANVSDVVVRFFDGDPENGGAQINGDKTIALITAGSTGTAQVDWELSCESTHLFVKVDPDNLIPESNEENNEINVTTTVYEMQKLLEKMNYFFDFYEEFYNYDDNATGADKEKESLCKVQNDDIWMCMVYPIKLSFMSGDDLTTGIDGNTWYSGPDPSGNIAFEMEFNKDDIPDELEELFDFCEFYVMFGGVPSYAPIYYNKNSNRAQILIDCWMEGLVPGLPKIKAGGKAYWFYVSSTDSIDMTDLENIYAETSVGLFEYNKSDSQKIKIIEDIEIGEVDYEITADGNLTIGASVRPSSTGEMIPKGVAPAAKIIVDAEGNASLAIYDQTIFNQPPDLDVDITLDEEPQIIFEGAMATSDFEAVDFIESPFDDFQYHDLKEFQPELRLMFDEIAVKVQGTLTYDLKEPLSYFDPYGGTIPIDMEFIVFPEFQINGNTKIFAEGPINIEVYDQSSRKLRQYDAYSPLEVSYSGSSVGKETRVITVPPTADRLILTTRGTKSGKYNMTILKPIVLINSTGTKILTHINYTINEISTQTNEIDYFDLDFRKIEYNIKKEVEAGKEISIAVREITETLDLDEDGIPDVSDSDLIFERKKSSLFADDILGQPGEEIVLKARLAFLDKNLNNRNITFMIDGNIIGDTTTDDEGNATINYIIPITASDGTHQLTMIFGGDDQYSESHVNASLIVVDTPPQVKISYPREFTTVNQTVIIAGEITDANLDSFAIKIDDAQVANSLPYTWDTTKYYEGLHIIKLNATDKSGNQNSIAIIVKVDNNIPTITITSPVNSTTYLTGLVNLNYSVSEPTVWESYSLDGAENVTLYGNTTLTGLREGTHTVTVYANDTSGNMGHSTVLFTVRTSTKFDTGLGTYPSIFGTHIGTITPSKNITVHKLYTYSCEGTGGHTEYVKIWNSTWNANATWKGYIGDWYNISFDNTVVLLANEIYNYTIRTGSYPQIHHTSALLTENGWINCTMFTDANGKGYNDWIPAIRLW